MNNYSVNGKEVKRLGVIELLKRVGPGIILTGVVIGPGNITMSAMLGANYGYDMIWLVLPIIFMGVTFMMTSYKISMSMGMPLIHGIRFYYGKLAAAIAGIATFLSCFFFTLGNITGTGAGMELLFHINWKYGSLLMLLVLLYCYFSKGTYNKVEKGIFGCIIAMIIAFYGTLIFLGGPQWGLLGEGLTHWQFATGSFATALGYISTNASVTAGVYGTYLGIEKKWKKEDLFNGTMFVDSLLHVLLVVLISGAIVLVGAIVLHPAHLSIKQPAQLAEMLSPFMGKYAPILMGVALLGAGFSSLLGNTQRGMVLLNAGLNKSVELESKEVKWGCFWCIIIATVLCFVYSGSPTQLIFIANIATSIATPLAGFFMTLLIFKKELYGDEQPSVLLKYSMLVSYVFVLIITGFAVMKWVKLFL